MIDPKLIRENIDLIRTVLKKRNMEGVVDLDRFRVIDGERRALIQQGDELREKRNRLSKEIGGRKSRGEDAADLMGEVH